MTLVASLRRTPYISFPVLPLVVPFFVLYLITGVLVPVLDLDFLSGIVPARYRSHDYSSSAFLGSASYHAAADIAAIMNTTGTHTALMMQQNIAATANTPNIIDHAFIIISLCILIYFSIP